MINATFKLALGIMGTVFCVVIGLVLIGVAISLAQQQAYVKCWAVILLAIPVDLTVMALSIGLAKQGDDESTGIEQK